MNSLKNKKVIIFLSLILILTISSVGGYYGYNYYQEQDKSEQDNDTSINPPTNNSNSYPTSYVPITPPTSNTNNGLTTYVDSETGFEISYPSGWVISTELGTRINDGSGKALFIKKENLVFQIQIQKNIKNFPHGCETSIFENYEARLKFYQLNGIKLYRSKVENGYLGDNQNNQLIYINQLATLGDDHTPLIPGEVGLGYCAIIIDKYYYEMIIFNSTKSILNTDQQYLNDIDKMIESIKFANK